MAHGLFTFVSQCVYAHVSLARTRHMTTPGCRRGWEIPRLSSVCNTANGKGFLLFFDRQPTLPDMMPSRLGYGHSAHSRAQISDSLFPAVLPCSADVECGQAPVYGANKMVRHDFHWKATVSHPCGFLIAQPSRSRDLPAQPVTSCRVCFSFFR